MSTQSVRRSGWAQFRRVHGADTDSGSTDLIDLLDTVDLPVVVVRCDLTIGCFNRSAAEVLSLSASNVGGPVSDIGELIGPDLAGWCAQVIAAGAPFRHEFRAEDGSFVVRIAPYFKNDRLLAGAVLSFTNVTAFRASIDQAIYEREFTKAIINTVTNPLAVLTEDLRVHSGNRAFYAMLGVSREDAQGVIFYQLKNGAFDLPHLRAQLHEALDGGPFQPFEVDHEFQGIDWTMLLDARQFSLPGYSNRMILLAFQDITARKKAEAANATLAAIVQSSDDAIVSKDLNGIITSWNGGAEKIFGYAEEEAIGKPITILIPPERQDEEPDILARIRRGERVEHYETVRRRKDGELVDISVTVSPVVDSSGRIIGASKIARDVSERRKTEATQRLLVGELAHRVKNTLATVQGLANQTLKGASSEERASFIARLHTLANAYDVLTQDNWHRAPLRDLVGKALQPFPSGRFVVDGPLVWVPASKALALTMAIHELATNAIKYGALSNETGRVLLDWRLLDDVKPQRLAVFWKEVGGPLVASPAHRGFGSRLIECSLDAVRLEFPPDGVCCALELAL